MEGGREGGRQGERESEREREGETVREKESARASEGAKVQRAGGGGREEATAQRKIYFESNEGQQTEQIEQVP
jgi:hypothetical protein